MATQTDIETRPSDATERLGRRISAEIQNDAFFRALNTLARSPDVHTLLEIGSSSGEGSTQALVSALRERPDKDQVKLFCMEISQPRFEALTECYREDGFVHCFQKSSVPSSSFPPPEELAHFFRTVRYKYKPSKAEAKLEQALSWRQADLDYLAQSGCDAHGIRHIKQQHDIDVFDFVLIDGSEFTGERELYEVMGAKYIALDDIMTFKCWNAHQILKNSANYRMVEQSRRLRNGYSVFERVF